MTQPSENIFIFLEIYKMNNKESQINRQELNLD